MVAVLFLDVDHFIRINESLGHDAGDRIICEVARRLEACILAPGTVGHIGADEFLIIAPALPDISAVEALAVKVLAKFQEPFVVDGKLVAICYFLPEFNARALERLKIEAHLRQALAKRELELNYQPLVEIESGRIVGAEALLRW